MDNTMNESVRTAPFAPFEWLLSGRYLRARRQEGFISIIAGFSFLGIMLGVATLIIVMAVMKRFPKKLRGKILGPHWHLLLPPPGIPAPHHPRGPRGRARRRGRRVRSRSSPR